MSRTADEDFLRPLDDQLEIPGVERHAHTEHDDAQQQDRMRNGPEKGIGHEIRPDDDEKDDIRQIFPNKTA